MNKNLVRALASESRVRSSEDLLLRNAIAATNAAAPWRLARDFGKAHLTGLEKGTNYLLIPGFPGTAEIAGTDGSADSTFDFDPTRYALTGRKTKGQLVVELLANGTSPACSFTTSVLLAGALSGAAAPRIAIGAAPSPALSITQTPSGSSSKTLNGSSEIEISEWAATFYVVQVTVSEKMAAGAYVTLGAKLEVKNV